MASAPMVRPLGCLEMMSSSRHALNLYRRLANTCRYHIPASCLESSQSLERLFEEAIARLVLTQASLRVGIANESSSKPYFVRIDRVDLSEHIQWKHAGNDIDLLRLIEEEQVQMFPDIAIRPPWKVIVVQTAENTVLDVIFLVHHSLCDGRNAAAFHRHLLAALSDGNGCPDQLKGHTLNLPAEIHMAPSMEEMIKFKTSWWFLLSTVWEELGPKWLRFNKPPKAWAGRGVKMEPQQLHLRKLEFSATDTTKLVAACRAQSTTLTGLLHACILWSLSRRLSATEATTFKAMTPISIAKLANPPPGTDLNKIFSVAVTGMSHDFNTTAVSSCRETPEANPGKILQADSTIFDIARRIRSDLQHRMETLPNDDVIALLSYVPSWEDFWLGKIGKARETSWEVSNIGCVEFNPARTTVPSTQSWRIDRSIFSQPVNITGAAFVVNVASVDGGLLTLTFNWQESVVSAELMSGVLDDMRTMITSLVES